MKLLEYVLLIGRKVPYSWLERKDHDGNTALTLAVQFSPRHAPDIRDDWGVVNQVVRILLNAGCNPNGKDGNDKQAIDFCGRLDPVYDILFKDMESWDGKF